MNKPVRLVLSYSGEDQTLAKELLRHLATLPKDPPIEIWHAGLIAPGQDLHFEVDRHLKKADIILPLLSADYLASEHTSGELQQSLARHHTGSAQIVPIRLRPVHLDDTTIASLRALPEGGPVSVSASRDQAWEEITRKLAQIIVNVSAGWQIGLESEVSTRPPAADKAAPQAPDSPYDRRWYVSRATIEKRALGRLLHPGSPVVLQGPSLSGKGHLVSHLVDQVCQHDPQARVVRLNFPSLGDGAFTSLDCLLHEIARRLLLEAPRREELLAQAWQRPGDAKVRLAWLMGRHVLRRTERLVLTIERADKVQGCDFRHEFFSTLRAWAQNQKDPWPRLRILVTLSVEPALLESTDTSMFFNLAPAIPVMDLDHPQLAKLAELYGLRPTPPEMDRLWDLLGGHPYLSRLLMYEAVLQDSPMGKLLDDLGSDGGLFAPHLHGLRVWLERNQMLDAVRAVLGNPRCSLRLDDFYRVYSKGLVVEEGAGVYRLRCQLYEGYFRTLCGMR